jgi:pimeloyl-ACP methyl ester carboxylesterase
MHRTVLLFLFCSLSPASAAQAQIAGQWQGYWFRSGDSLAVTLHVQRDPTTNAYSATFDSDRLRVTGIPFAEVKVQGCCDVTMRLQGDRTSTLFTGTIRGNILSGTLREEQSEGRFAYSRVPTASAPLVEREITFQNGDVLLAGSLILPAKGSRHPAVVFIHGSGGEGRWASRYLATAFAAHGVAALIYDKRGVGKSSGDWRTATLDDLAGDAAAAVARLRQEKEIDGQRIGIHGHSQGGTLAPMIAARSKTIAFLIASAAAGVPPDSTEIFSVLNSVYPNATSSADSANVQAYVIELVAVAYQGRPRNRLDSLVVQFQGRPWFFAPPAPDASYWSFSRILAQYRPLDWWRQVRVPVLLIYGAEDQRVPAAESAARIAGELLRQTPDADVTVRILPNADHSFRLPPGPSGWPNTAPDYLPTLLNWLSQRR